MLSFVKGFVLGFLCGAAAGLLLSPQSGQKNTGQMRQRVQDALEAGRQAAQSYQSQMANRYHQMISLTEESEESEPA
jgi:gas vesicle protein